MKTENLCKIRNISKAISEFENNILEVCKLSLNEVMLLCTLSKCEQITSGELAESLGLTCSNTSKVIKSLEDKEFIERRLGKADKRQMILSITKKGREKLKEINSNNNIEVPDILEDIIKTIS